MERMIRFEDGEEWPESMAALLFLSDEELEAAARRAAPYVRRAVAANAGRIAEHIEANRRLLERLER